MRKEGMGANQGEGGDRCRDVTAGGNELEVKTKTSDPWAKDELVSRPRGDGPLPNPEGLQGAVGLPRFEQLDDWLAPVGPSGPGCPYHPLQLATNPGPGTTVQYSTVQQ